MQYRRAPGVIEEVVDGRTMLIPPDGSEMLTLNETGSALWSAMVDPTTPSDLTDRVLDQFEVERTTLEGDVRGFLDELAEAAVVISDT